MKIPTTLITPITIASFIIMSVTGVLLFFHLDIGLNKLAHEWLSWLFLVSVGLHIFLVHRKSFTSYFKRPSALGVIGGAIVITALSFISLGGDEGMPPFLKAEHALYKADLNLVSQVLDISESTFREGLAKKGIVYNNEVNSLEAIAKLNGLSQKEIMGKALSN